MAEFYDPNWTKNDIIRHKTTGQPYLVIHVYLHTATIVVDLFERTSPNTQYVILPKDYSIYAKDQDMSVKKKDKVVVWEYCPVFL